MPPHTMPRPDTWRRGPSRSPQVDRVADVDVAVAVAVRSHVAHRGEARAQIGLRVLNGDERRSFRRPGAAPLVVHVRVRVDEAGQDRSLAEIDDRRARRNRDAPLGPDLGDALARDEQTWRVSICPVTLSKRRPARKAIVRAAPGHSRTPPS